MASDGVLTLASIQSDKELVLTRLGEVMRGQPNRQSLMLAMRGFSSQRGGTQEQADWLCARYAPTIKADPPYDAATCSIDTTGLFQRPARRLRPKAIPGLTLRD